MLPLGRGYKADQIYELPRILGEWFTDTIHGHTVSREDICVQGTSYKYHGSWIKQAMAHWTKPSYWHTADRTIRWVVFYSVSVAWLSPMSHHSLNSAAVILVWRSLGTNVLGEGMSLITTAKIVAEGLMAVTFALSINLLWISRTSSSTSHVAYLTLVAETTACRCAISSSTLRTGWGNRTLCGFHGCAEVRTIWRQFAGSWVW